VKEKRCKTHGKRNTTRRVSRIRKGKIHRDKTPKQALAKKRIKPKALRVVVVEFARAVRCQKKILNNKNQGILLTSHTNLASGNRYSPPPRRRRYSSTSLSGRNSQEKKATKRKKER
jgi:hypothetical protein